MVLVLVALLSFFLLVGRLLDLLRPRRLYAQLVEGGGRAVADVYPGSSAVKQTPSEPLPPATETVAYDGPSGVISALDRSRLVLAATAAETTIELLWAVGSAVHPGAPLYRIRGAASHVSHDLLVRSVIVSEERTITQDPAFAIRTIVDIAIRALSPAVNDPTTAVQALDALESLLQTVAGRDLEGGRLFDARGELRVVYPVAGWQELVRLAFTEIRRYGADSPQVARRLRSLLDSLLERTSADRHAAVEEQLALLDSALLRAYEDPEERALAATPDHLGLGGPEPAGDPSA